MKNQQGLTLGSLLAIMFFSSILIGSGWVLNIYKLASADFEAPYKTEIIRTVGIFPPVGMVVGWMDIGEENIKTTAEK